MLDYVGLQAVPIPNESGNDSSGKLKKESQKRESANRTASRVSMLDTSKLTFILYYCITADHRCVPICSLIGRCSFVKDNPSFDLSIYLSISSMPNEMICADSINTFWP